MGLTPTAPQRAIETCADRLRAIGGIETPAPGVTWFGPAAFGADRPGSEAAIQAACGLMQVNGRDGGRPRRLGLDVASVAAGLLAAQGAIAAGIAGRLGHPVLPVHTSVLQAGLLLLSHYFVVATGLGDAVPGPPLPATGPPFRSADDRWFEIETLEPEPWQAFWTALGQADANLGRAWTLFRWRYERATCSLPAGLHDATQLLPLAELERVAVSTGVSLMPLRTYADVLVEPGPDAARPVLRAGGDASPPPAPPDDHSGLPLAGIRVVEATSRIQGPFAGMLLRMLGAQVTRVQPPEGDYGRAALCLHRGKDAVRLDLGLPGGRSQLVDLVAGADVFLHNWRPGKAAEWGLEFDDLVRRQPGLVYANTSGWGDRPEARRLVGTDFLVQAYAGIGHGLHPQGEPPFPSRVILSDLFGGLIGAEGVLTGLYRRLQTGMGQEVRSSLLDGAMTLQAHVLDDLARGKEDGRRDGRPVWGPLDRPVRTTDGDLMVSVDDDDTFERVCSAFKLDAASSPRAAVDQAVVARLRAGVAADLADQLCAAGVPAAVVCGDLAAVAADLALAPLFEPVGEFGVAPRSPWTFG